MRPPCVIASQFANWRGNLRRQVTGLTKLNRPAGRRHKTVPCPVEIFIIIDGALYEKVPVGQTYTTTLKGIANKNVLVRFGAESAKMSMTVTRDYEGIA